LPLAQRTGHLNLLSFQPLLNDADDVVDVRLSQRNALRHTVPFCQAVTAAGGGGVLSDEDRVAAHGRLPAVVRWVGRSQSLTDKLSRVLHDQLKGLARHVASLAFIQLKTTPECRSLEAGEKLLDVPHHLLLPSVVPSVAMLRLVTAL
jgi:hypothetical protein